MVKRKEFVYVCSKFKGKTFVERNRNVEFARQRAVEIYAKGYIPICVHIYLEQATDLNETNGDRKELLELGKEFIRLCHQVWVFGEVSEGMKGEIQYAKKLKKEIKWI